MEATLERLVGEFTLPFHNSVLIFTVILIIILLAPFALSRIRIPGIIVLILSGIVIGPQGFNLIANDEAVNLFSTIGVLYIMFLAGLELEADEFFRNRNKSIFFGVMTFLIPLVIGFPVCYYILGLEPLTSLLAASMLSTHTLIAYPIVSKLDLIKNEAVAITIGGTIIADTAVLIILAMVHGLNAQNADWTLWLNMGISFTLFFLFMLKLVPMVAKWVLKRVENERYTHYIFVLATVFLSAFVAELAGLEAIIGAFTSGLVLNRLIPKTSPLMSRIEFAGNALFIPFFLISVGMIIDMGALLSGTHTLWTALVITVVAFAGKWLAAFITARFLKYSPLQQNLIFGLSSARVAATLAVITVGYNIDLLDLNILNAGIILILISCIASTLLTENTARKMAMQKSTEIMISAETEFERILVTISNPATMIHLTDFALNISVPRNNIPVYVLSVVNDNQQAKQKLTESRQILEKLIKHGAETEREIEIITTLDQNVASGIRRVITEVAATDLVLGTSTKSRFSDVVFGNLMQHLMNSTNQLLFFYKPVHLIYQHSSLQIICPPLSDKEYGFQNWLRKITLLAKNLNIPARFYSDKRTLDAIQYALLYLKIKGNFEFKTADVFNEMDRISSSFQDTELIVFIQPRKGSVSSFSVDVKKVTSIMDEKKNQNAYLIISPNHPNPVIQYGLEENELVRRELIFSEKRGNPIKWQQ
jgi:Kef-type K+ transport system membrane component KefB/nucleotide-binding universal stress UspA family protein